MFNNKFLKHDPLLEAVKTAQAEGALRRQAEAQVNEEFGVYSRKAVIRENLAAYDARLAELVEAKLADKDYDKDGKIESPKDEVWGSRLRAAKMAGKMEEEQIDEISRDTLKSYVKKADRQANNLERKVDRRKDRPGEEEKMYKRIEGANLARRKMGVRVAATEETDYSAQDRAPVTKSAPKEDPSLPKSYPGAASSAPTAQRLSNAKAAVTPIKEDEQLDELKAPTAKTAHDAYRRAERSDDEMGNWDRSNRLYGNLKKRYPGKSGRNQKPTGKAKLPQVSNTEFHKAGYSGHVTKKGKLTKSATKDTKADIKSRLGRHTKPNLPEEVMKESILAKLNAKHMKEEITIKRGDTMTSLAKSHGFGGDVSGFAKSVGFKGDVNKIQAGAKLGSPATPAKTATPTTWKDPVSAGYDKPAASSAPETKPTSLPTMAQSNVGPKAGAGAGVASLPGASQSASITNPKPAMDPGSIENAKRKTGSLNESVQVGANKYRIV